MSDSRGSPGLPGREVTVGTASSEAPRRQLSTRQAETVQKLAVAAVHEVREVGFDQLTVRNVARRAGVAPATAYTYFTSKEHLVTEVFWRRLNELADPDPQTGETGHARPAADRVGDTLEDLALLVAGEPELAAACTTAMLASDPDVAVLRDRIGATIHRRLYAGLAGGADSHSGADSRDRVDPLVLRSLELLVSGALLQAGMGYVAYTDLPDQLRSMANLVVAGVGRGER